MLSTTQLSFSNPNWKSKQDSNWTACDYYYLARIS